MLILFGLQLALSIWIFAANDKFLTSMSKVVDRAWDENNAAQGYPMDALQLAVSIKSFLNINYRFLVLIYLFLI